MALERFKVNHKDCDLILSDIRMPDMNGNELCKGRKENQSKCKSNLMSAFVIQEKEFHNVLPDIKVYTFLQKPFSIQELNDVVEKINTNID
jgi:YesN/AraC family two-component response regulator